MGRPYETELAELSETYAWSMSASPASLAATIARTAGLPLLAIGSGGSLTSASAAAVLHTRFTGQLARTMTPYDIAGAPIALADMAVLLCSAGGSNPDILSCFRALAHREPALLTAVCMRLKTPLAKAAAAHEWTTCHEFRPPVRKDGFLATNSLLATIILLIRAYEHVFSATPSLPCCLAELLDSRGKNVAYWSAIEQAFQPLCERPTLAVLHGNLTQPAAADIESRFTEAAIGNVQLADFRNFAHGRHHWLATKARETGVLILSTPNDQVAAERTASLLPKAIPTLRLEMSEGLPGMLSAIIHSVYLGWFAAKSQGRDPGRPKVAQFGRRLYHVRAMPDSPYAGISIPPIEACAIERKSRLTITALEARNQLPAWRSHYSAFVTALAAKTFHGIVFDYDGTLCGAEERFTGLRPEIVSALLSMLRAGILIGVATGRGKSVREVLRAKIRRRALWGQILIGYHNAGEIAPLDDNLVPPTDPALDNRLKAIHTYLTGIPEIVNHARQQAKGTQITLEVSSPSILPDVWNLVTAAVRRHGDPCLQIVRSTHSIDILAPGISKRSLLSAVSHRLGQDHKAPAVLCIGDRGRWPGNDFALLEHPYSLSVDETSHDRQTCWNLAPPGVRSVEACLHYLQRVEIISGAFRLKGLGGRK